MQNQKAYYAGRDFSVFFTHEGKSKLDGAPVGSGRYPLGSGERPNQHIDGRSGGKHPSPMKRMAERIRSKAGGASKMTNEELKSRIDRLDLENRYRTALANSKSATRRAFDRAFEQLQSKMIDSLTSPITSLISEVISSKVDDALSGEFSNLFSKTLGKYMDKDQSKIPDYKVRELGRLAKSMKEYNRWVNAAKGKSTESNNERDDDDDD